MLTVLDAITKSADYLEKKGIESARLNAELMLAELLKCRRLDLYLKFDQPLKDPEITSYRDWISRRGKFEPLQYITGNVEFYGLNFLVNKNVLIPRPETEILVEKIIEDFPADSSLKILDIGTGSGCISIALAKHFPNSRIVALDISEDAINSAKSNAALNKVDEQINFICSDIRNYNDDRYFHIIVSNPPYISLTDYDELQNEIKYFEPRIALTDDEDGFTFYKIISKYSIPKLISNGKLYFEVGAGQAESIKEIIKGCGFNNVESYKDLSSIDRVVVGIRI